MAMGQTVAIWHPFSITPYTIGTPLRSLAGPGREMICATIGTFGSDRIFSIVAYLLKKRVGAQKKLCLVLAQYDNIFVDT